MNRKLAVFVLFLLPSLAHAAFDVTTLPASDVFTRLESVQSDLTFTKFRFELTNPAPSAITLRESWFSSRLRVNNGFNVTSWEYYRVNQSYSYLTNETIYRNVCGANIVNASGTFGNCSNVVDGWHWVDRTVPEQLVPLDNYQWLANSTIDVVVIARYAPKLGPRSADWVPSLNLTVLGKNKNFERSDWTWFNSSFSYRKPVYVNSSNATTPSGYAVLVNVTWNAHMTPNFVDLRFVNGSDTTALDYYVETYVASSYANVWVEVDQNISTSNYTFYMYYGNASAVTSLSNGSATFTWFDDFESYTNGTVPTGNGWGTFYGTISGTYNETADTSFNYNTGGSKSLKTYDGGADAVIFGTDLTVGHPAGLSGSWAFGIKTYAVAITSYSFPTQMEKTKNSNVPYFSIWRDGAQNYAEQRYSGGYINISSWKAANWEVEEFRFYGSATNCTMTLLKNYVINSSYGACNTNQNNVSYFEVSGGAGAGQGTYYSDVMYVRPLVDPEVTNSFGAEESSPTKVYAINFSSPTNDTWTISPYLNTTYFPNATAFYNCSVNVNGTTVLNSTTIVNSSANYFNVSLNTTGYYYFNVTCWANTSSGVTSEQRLLKFDNVSPSCKLDAPANASFFQARTGLTLNLTFSDALSGTNASWTNDTNWASYLTSSPFNFTNTSALAEGPYAVLASCNDTAGNANASSAYFTIDRTAPTWAYVSPTRDNDSIYVNPASIFYLNATYVETNFDNATVTCEHFGITHKYTTGLSPTCGSNYCLFAYEGTGLSPCWNSSSSTNGSRYTIINMTFYDKASNTNTTDSRTFWYDNAAPTSFAVDPTSTANSTVVNDTYGGPFFFNVTFKEYHPSHCAFVLDGSELTNVTIYNTTSWEASDHYCQDNFTGLPAGNHTVAFRAYDRGGLYATSDVYTYYVDATPPVVSITAPLNASYLGPTSSYAITGAVIDNINASAAWTNDTHWTGISYGSAFNFTNTTPVVDGVYTVLVTGNDTVNLTNSSYVTFTVDSVAPAGLAWVTPTFTNNSVIHNILMPFNLSFTEANPYSANYTCKLIWKANGTTANTQTGSSLLSTPSSYYYSAFFAATGCVAGTTSDGSERYEINETIFDKAGNSASSTFLWATYDITAPASIALNSPTSPNGTVKTPSNNWFYVNTSFVEYDPMTCEFYENGSAIANVTPTALNVSTAYCGYNFTSLANATYDLYVRVYDLANNSDVSGMMRYYIDGMPPNLNVTTPVNGTVFPWRSNVTIYGYGYDVNGLSSLWTNNTHFATYGTIVGNYSWSVANSSALTPGAHSILISLNDTPGNVNTTSLYFTVDNFSVTADSPGGVTLTGTTAVLTYTTNSTAPLNCSLMMNSTVENSTIVPSSATIDVTVNVSTGTHDWNVTCAWVAAPTFTYSSATLTFASNTTGSYASSIIIGPAESVLASPQRIFFDNTGYVNAFYFNPGTPNTLRIRKFSGTSVIANYSANLTATKDFLVAFREDANLTKLLAYATDNTTAHYIDLNSTITIFNVTEGRNVTSNANWDPYSYANTRQFDSLNYSLGGFYVFILPQTNGTQVVRKNLTQNNLSVIATPAHVRNFAWRTIAKYDNLTQWYYAAPKVYNATYDQIAVYSYAGTAASERAVPETTAFNQSMIENAIVSFEAYGNYTYLLVANATSNATVFRVEDNATVVLNYSIPAVSDFYFNDEDTFVFFSQESLGDFVYSCYFGNATPSCRRISMTEYGVTVPFTTGRTTGKRVSTSDVTLTGQIISSSSLIFAFTQNTYDVKFICYDEQNDVRKFFTTRIYADNFSAILSGNVWGYVVPSATLGNGTKKAYGLCDNGTQRLMVVGLNGAFALDLYSLNLTVGAYYTFHVQNQYGVALPNVVLSAYRFSNAKQNWVVVEQGITDFAGNAVFYLEPLNLYHMTAAATGYTSISFDFNPSGTTTVNIQLEQSGGAPIVLPDFENVWNDTSYSLSPSYDSSFGGAMNVSYQVYNSNSSLEYYGMNITRSYNGTTTSVFYGNMTTQPAGGLYSFNTTDPGAYRIDYWFKRQDYDEFHPMSRTFYVGNTSGLADIRQRLLSNPPLSPWGFYFVAVIISTGVAMYVSRFTYEGAGIAGLVVLWAITLFMPGTAFVVLFGGVGITPVMATAVTTVVVAAAVILRSQL